MRPFIGITCSAEPDGRPVVRPQYVQAVHAAGGLPVPLPFVTDEQQALTVLEGLHGVLLSGGTDLDSALWGEPLHPRSELMHPARQATELAVCRALLRLDLPALGICGGMQALNVALGGSLHQHLPDLGQQILDHAAGVEGPRHAVEADADSLLAAALGRRFETNSAHHQAIARLGRGLRVTARSSDGVIEGCELPGRRFVHGVQWHPERMPEVPGQCALFAALLEAAASLPAAAR